MKVYYKYKSNALTFIIVINVEIIIIYTYPPFTLILAMYPLLYCACAHGLNLTQELL